MNDEILEKLKKFIIEERWEYDFPLMRDTRIENDLDIYGDDADDFIIAFGKEFNVDVSWFRIGEYFNSENSRPFNVKKKKNLTIAHLEKAVIAGRLDEEVINGWKPITEKLKNFIIKEAVVDKAEVTREAGIESDLGIYGDDAYDFIIAFGKEFKVDVSHFMAADYFSPEGDFILPAIIRALTGRKKKKQKELTVGHLEKAVIAGRLDEEVINSR
ncbi:MAG: DUF1493 family protein [Flavobacteriaceae bacterium]|jgi:acyl carrier protein|nr:DUF1493 family protein [Flavobacteriaceae bacterium]